MQELALYAAIFLAAATPVFEVWIAVPAGIAAGLPAVPVALVGIAGNFVTVALVVYAGDGIRTWWSKRRTATLSEDAPVPPVDHRTERLQQRFGLPGLALVAPFVIGSHLGALGALALGSSRSAVLSWFTASLVLQAAVFGGMAAFGVDYFLGQATDISLPTLP